MPVYEFTCRDCRKNFEIIESITRFDSKKVVCPHCRSRNVDRHWSGVHLETTKKS